MNRSLSILLLISTFFIGPALGEEKNLVETASDAGNFQTLLAAAQAADLVDTLSGPGPLTIFAPTDDAFNALPKGTVAELLKPENKAKLGEILKYHVVAGRVSSGDALKLDSAATVAGPSIQITPTDGGANINDARLIATDIDATNGVIHVVDRVLLPPPSHSETVTAAKPAMSSRALAKSTLVGAIHQGVPIYNAGDHYQCAAIYMQALQSVAAMTDCGLSSTTMSAVHSTLHSSQQTHNMTDRAWTLRRQMDRVLMEL